MSKLKQPRGLSVAEVSARVETGQINTMPSEAGKTNWGILSYHLTRISNIVILVSVVLLGVYGEVGDALLIGSVILFNMLSAIVQEFQAKSQLEKISSVHEETATVIRENEQIDIPANEIVKDDVFLLQSGDTSFVDAEILVEDHILVDDSALTGESDYKALDAGDTIRSGTVVVAGRAYSKAKKVGADSFLNELTVKTRAYSNNRSPLEKYIDRFIQYLTGITLFMLLLLFTINFFVLDLEPVALVEAVVSIVGAMVPQGIVVAVTLSFLFGVVRMYRNHILIQKASAIQTMAALEVLCMDKTGTITKNKLKVVETEQFGQNKELEAKLLSQFLQLTAEKNKTILALQDRYNVSDSDKDLGNVGYQLSFTSKSKFSALSLEFKSNYYYLALGSVDKFTDMFPEMETKKLLDLETKFADQGLRNVLFMIAELTESQFQQTTEFKKHKLKDVTAHLRSFGKDQVLNFRPSLLIGIQDELRPGARDILLSFIEQKIKPVIISGDGPRTLQAIVKQLNIKSLTKVTTGPDLQQLSKGVEKTDLILATDIFARVSPEQKEEIVSIYQQHYGVVGMIGDGVNDALAIKKADLGIAMGSGVKVTKNISAVVLLDDNLENLATVIREGRQILFNTLRTTKIFISKNAYSLIIILGALFLGTYFPYAPKNLFLISFLNANIPVMTLLLDRSEPKKVDFVQDLSRFILLSGFFSGLIGLLLLVYATFWTTGYDQLAAQTILATFLIFVGIINSLIILNDTYELKGMFFGSWRALVGLATFAIFSIIVTVPFLRVFFDLSAYRLDFLPVISVSVVSYYILLRLSNYLTRDIDLRSKFGFFSQDK